MPLPWYITTMTKVFSFPLLPIYPFILPLEAMRGAYLSGTSLALFIDIPSCTCESGYRELSTLRGFLDRTRAILENIPDRLLPMAGPWIDYYNAAECFYSVADMLLKQRCGLPASCEGCWKLEEKETQGTPSP